MTTTTTNLADLAAAGLGRKVRTMTITTDSGTTRGTATNGETWVDVVAHTGDGAGTTGSIDPQPARSGVTADATLCGRELRRIVTGIVPATDTESSRYALGGTLVEIAEGAVVFVVATDGRRMHIGSIQPASVHGQAAPIVPAAQWKALDAAVRAAVRRIVGVTGAKLAATIDRGTVRIMVGRHQPTGGEVVTIAWAGDGVTVQAHGVAVAGRFPRWRDARPEAGAALTASVGGVLEALDTYRPLYRAAEKAARAAWKADREEKKRQRRYHGGDFLFPVGVDCGPESIAGCGADWSRAVPAAPVAVRLDHTYLADAFDGAAAWGVGSVTVSGTDDRSAVMISTGEYGGQFTAVIMPLARD